MDTTNTEVTNVRVATFPPRDEDHRFLLTVVMQRTDDGEVNVSNTFVKSGTDGVERARKHNRQHTLTVISATVANLDTGTNHDIDTDTL